MNREVILTADGSHSLYVKELDEHYHSIHGAIQESKHVFIQTGLYHVLQNKKPVIKILEIGFGTGLNALLTLLEAEKLNVNIHYTSLEGYPLNIDLTKELNYTEIISQSEKTEKSKLDSVFNKLHTCTWDKEIVFSNNFILQKINKTLQEVEFTGNFDLIYYDAFGPRVQPEMWIEEIFKKIYAATAPQGCLVTYCAKGEVKRTLKKTGYTVETLPGPPRKREMIRGTKN